MKAYILAFSVLASTIVFGSKIVNAEDYCMHCRSCTPAYPCEIHDPEDFIGAPPRSITLGHGCSDQEGAGATSCTHTVRRNANNQRFGICSLEGVGCCSVPCRPPAIGCEPG